MQLPTVQFLVLLTSLTLTSAQSAAPNASGGTSGLGLPSGQTDSGVLSAISTSAEAAASSLSASISSLTNSVLSEASESASAALSSLTEAGGAAVTSAENVASSILDSASSVVASVTSDAGAVQTLRPGQIVVGGAMAGLAAFL